MITLYQKSTCTKCRQTKRILEEAGVKYEEVSYYDTPLTVEDIKGLLKKLKMKPRELMRTGEEIYKRLDLKNEGLTNDQLIRSMANNPDLIQRPIIVKGKKAVLGRPPENVRELL